MQAEDGARRFQPVQPRNGQGRLAPGFGTRFRFHDGGASAGLGALNAHAGLIPGRRRGKGQSQQRAHAVRRRKGSALHALVQKARPFFHAGLSAVSGQPFRKMPGQNRDAQSGRGSRVQNIPCREGVRRRDRRRDHCYQLRII